MKDYKLVIADDVDFDIEEAIEWKEEHDAYLSTINELLEAIDKCYGSPHSGSNLSARVSRPTKVKYFLIKDYVLLYEITGENEVTAYRFLSTKSDWISMIQI